MENTGTRHIGDSVFPNGRVSSDGGLLPELPRIFDLLGGDSWTVYRFLFNITRS
jgi:hypothetical protein